MKIHNRKTFLIVAISIVLLFSCGIVFFNLQVGFIPYFMDSSPNGEKIVLGFASWHRLKKEILSQIFIYSVEQKKIKYLGCAEAAYLSPDGGMVCFITLSKLGKKNVLVIADSKNFPRVKFKKTIIYPAQKPEEKIMLLGWSPKGNYLAFLKTKYKNIKEKNSQNSIIGQSFIIWGVNDESMKLIELERNKANPDHISISWSSEEDVIFYIKEPTREVYSVSIKEGIEKEVSELIGYRISEFFLQKDGSIVLFVPQSRPHGDSRRIFKKDIVTGEMEDMDIEIGGYAFHSKDGRYVGVSKRGGKLSILDLQTKEISELNVGILSYTASIPTWWYDNKFLFFIGPRLYSLNFQGEEFDQIFPSEEKEHIFYFYRHLLF